MTCRVRKSEDGAGGKVAEARTEVSRSQITEGPVGHVKPLDCTLNETISYPGILREW